MKPIKAQKQVNLGPARAFQLAMTGMMYRFFRSGVTVAILCLAVAFLVHTLIYGLLAHSSEYRAYVEIREQRELGGVMGRLLRPDSVMRVIDGLAADSPGRIAEYRNWGELSQNELDETIEWARRVKEAERHFDRLPHDNRAILVGDADILSILRRFQEHAQYDLFVERSAQLDVGYPLEDEIDFRRLVRTQWPQLARVVDSIRSGHGEAIAAIREAYPDRAMRELLISPPDEFSDVLRREGVVTEDMDFEELAVFAARDADRETIETMLSERGIQAALVRQLDIPAVDISLPVVYRWLLSRDGDADWFSAQLQEEGVRLSPERLVELAEFHFRYERLQEVAGDEPPVSEAGLFSLSGDLQWLIILAFFVCIVGVANAMLMSVTERFTEIATMKCLGAMDGFVMMMFVFEAAIQGFIGGIIGIGLGILLALIRGFSEFGGLLAIDSGVFSQMLFAGFLSMFIGILLAAVAAVGPSLVAARLAPMEAMRVE